jgi:hypothetical protein
MASSNPRIPYVRDGRLYRHDGTLVCAVASSLADKTGWYDWLENPLNKSFAFTASNGAHCTCVKEKRRASSGRIHFYWFAYRSINNIKKRVGLGKSIGINLAKLSKAAGLLAQGQALPVSELGKPLGQPQAKKRVREPQIPPGQCYCGQPARHRVEVVVGSGGQNQHREILELCDNCAETESLLARECPIRLSECDRVAQRPKQGTLAFGTLP